MQSVDRSESRQLRAPQPSRVLASPRQRRGLTVCPACIGWCVLRLHSVRMRHHVDGRLAPTVYEIFRVVQSAKRGAPVRERGKVHRTAKALYITRGRIMVEKPEDTAALLERISTGSKQFYSAGASFSTVTCAAIVLIVWGSIAKFSSLFAGDVCGLVLS